MKKWLLPVGVFMLLVGIQGATAQFTLNGKVGNLNAPAKAYLVYKLGANQKADSATITNGAFSITGTLIEPVMAQLVIDHKGEGLEKLAAATKVDLVTFFLENSIVGVSAATDSVYNADITGSVLNDESKLLRAQLNDIETEAKKLNEEYTAAPPEKQKLLAFKNAMQAKATLLQARQKNILKTFITGHTDSFLSIIALGTLGAHAPNAAELEGLYSLLSPRLKEMESGKVIKQSVDLAKVTAIGSIAPDFTQNDVNGKPVSLSSFRGKYVLIDFWASWCGPCRQENPNVVRVYNKYKGKNFTILGVSLDKPDARNYWLAAIKKDGLMWTQVSDLKFWDNAAARLFYVSAIPANFLLDPQGKIIARDLRGDDLDKKLADVL